MAVTELFDSRLQTKGDNKSERSSTTFVFLADGYSDEPSAIAAVEAFAGPTYGTQRRLSTEIVERINNSPNQWKVKVKFIDIPATIVQYDSTGGTQHVTQDIALSSSYGNTENVNGAIGFDGENVAGLDKVVPIFNWTEIRYFLSANLDVPDWYALEGKVNSDAWGGIFNAGEVLFLGFTGQEKEDGLWEMSFKFSYQPNKSGLTVGTITGISKKGWEYLDVYYKKVAGVKTIIPKPDAVYIHQVYDTDSFTTRLGFNPAL